MAQFVVVPQWQGSPSSRAMLLADGAQTIAGDLPRASCTVIDVPLEAGEALGTGVHRASALQRVAESVRDELALHDGHTVVIGGDCGVVVPAVASSAARHGRIAVVWCDAHPDLHDPGSSPSGAFSGMALRAVLGDGADGLALPPGLVPPDRVVLVGARAFDDAELERATPLTRIEPTALANAEAIADAVSAMDVDAVFVHVDLDVIDPAEIAGVTEAVPFGVAAAELVAALTALRQRVPLAGAALTGFAPRTPADAVDDMGTILRLVGALA